MTSRPIRPLSHPWLIGGTILVAVGAMTAAVYSILPRPEEVTPSSGTPSEVPIVRFTDLTARAGIRFRHTNGATPNKLLPETMGSGVAFLDYDNDGLPDLLFINSCPWPDGSGKPTSSPTMALYHNEGNRSFTDVTAGSGLDVSFYGMGVTVGDYDNDGFADVLITGLGQNRLFHNVPAPGGGRRFEDVTRSSGDLARIRDWPERASGDFLHREQPMFFGTSAAWLDYDGDGLLDLFVCNYAAWSPGLDFALNTNRLDDKRVYAPPSAFEGTQCQLYRNLGGGRFEDVSARAGIQVLDHGKPVSKALGVIVQDIDDDGWPDIIVANDGMRNFLFHNKGDGTFEEIALKAGLAFAMDSARAGMGIDAGEFRPGVLGVLIVNFSNEPNSFFRQVAPRQLRFADAALVEGIAAPSAPFLKFGAFFFDYDLDGRLDLLTCNGHVDPDMPAALGQQQKQSVQLFWNNGRLPAFLPVSKAQSGEDLFQPLVGRGSAFADIDGDGYPDVVLTENGGAARLLHNEGGTGHHWIRLALEGDGVHSNRSALGARVTVESSDLVQRQEVKSARGYLSQSELTLTFGLGTRAQVDRVTIQWPGKNSGPPTVLTSPAIDQTHRIRQAAP